MVIPTDRETKHIMDQNVHKQGYSDHEITKIKTEYTNLMWGNNKVDNEDNKKYTRTSNKKILLHQEQTWKYRENKLYKLTDTMRQIYIELENSNIILQNSETT